MAIDKNIFDDVINKNVILNHVNGECPELQNETINSIKFLNIKELIEFLSINYEFSFDKEKLSQELKNEELKEVWKIIEKDFLPINKDTTRGDKFFILLVAYFTLVDIYKSISSEIFEKEEVISIFKKIFSEFKEEKAFIDAAKSWQLF